MMWYVKHFMLLFTHRLRHVQFLKRVLGLAFFNRAVDEATLQIRVVWKARKTPQWDPGMFLPMKATKAQPILGSLKVNLSQFDSNFLAISHVYSFYFPSTKEARLVDAVAAHGN